MHEEGSAGSCSAESTQDTVDVPAVQAEQQLRSLLDVLLGNVTHYSPLGVLGSGSCGVVVRAVDTRCKPPAEVAVKLFPRGDYVHEYRTYLMREIVHTASLRHPVIIPLKEAFLTPSHLCIAMDYCRGGDLHQYLNGRPGCRVSEGEARWLFQQLAIGLQYCHSRGVANRDLKLENLLLDDAAAAWPLLKICDFGYSKHEKNSSAKSAVGTTAYMSPEIVLGAFSALASYDAKVVDAWAAGVVLFVLMCGRYPFDPGSTDFARRVVAAHYAFPPGVEVSPPCRDLLARLLEPDPKQRATIDEVTHHPWFLQDLPPGASSMNALLARHAAKQAVAEAKRGREMAAAVQSLVLQAMHPGAPGESTIAIPL